MKPSFNINNSDFQKIDAYLNGQMSVEDKRTFEKEVQNSPFLKDALEGFENNPTALSDFKQLKQAKKPFKTNWITILLVTGSVVLGNFLFYRFYPAERSVESTKKVAEVTETPKQNFELIPATYDTLSPIEVEEEIQAKEITEHHTKDKKFSSQDQQQVFNSHPNEIIDIKAVEFIEFDEEIKNTSNQTHKVYPFVYYYDMAVVDYTKYENRTQTITKSQYVLSGLDAAYESESNKNQSELIEKKVEIAYMDYLEESMYYFSKRKYKQALQHFDVIITQYKNDLNALFYGGLSYFNLKQFEQAKSNFERIIEMDENPFYEDAEWYLVKIYIKQNQIQKAKKSLNHIIIQNGFYTPQAIELKNKLSV